jgi:replicative DNA helicase
MTRTNPTNRAAESTTDILDRQPPFDLHAEQAVLGSIFLAPDILDEMIAFLAADDFFDDAHRRIFIAAKTLHETQRGVDIVQLVSHLKAQQEFEVIGGAANLYKIGQATPNAAHWLHYSRIVRDHAIRRAVIQAATETLREAYEDGLPDELLAQSEARLAAVSDAYVRGTTDSSGIREVITAALDRLDRRRHGQCDGIRTGFVGFDRLTSGIHRKQVLIVGARPSQGKTSALLQIGAATARECQVLFISLEMSSVELSDRMLWMASGVEGHRLRNGTCSTEQTGRVVRAAASLAERHLWIQDTYALNIAQIGAIARRHRRRHGLDVLLIDYCQLIRPDNPRADRHEQVAAISRALKGLARELNVALVVAAQVNRQPAEGAKPPQLHNLKESGAIEQDADVVVFCHIPDAYDKSLSPDATGASVAEWHIAKQRNGPVGVVDMLFRRPCSRWEDRATDRQERDVCPNLLSPVDDDDQFPP